MLDDVVGNDEILAAVLNAAHRFDIGSDGGTAV